MKTLLLIDASAIIYRFFHALPPLTTPDHTPIQGIYGLANVLIKIFREQKPDYAAAALDRPEKTFREEQFEEYKIHRPPAPDSLTIQLKKLPELFERFGIKSFEQAGFEADDIIGTLAEKFSGVPDLKIVILSGDLDILQLVAHDKIVGQLIKTGVTNTEIYNAAKVYERYGLEPQTLGDYKGLIGDASDNIPGVKGIGPKTARELLQEFKTLENVFENLALIPEKIVMKLQDSRAEAFKYRELATIKRDAPIEVPDLEELQVKEIPKDKLKSYFQDLGFVSLVKRLEE